MLLPFLALLNLGGSRLVEPGAGLPGPIYLDPDEVDSRALFIDTAFSTSALDVDLE